jgi:hypothetical protein
LAGHSCASRYFCGALSSLSSPQNCRVRDTVGDTSIDTDQRNGHPARIAAGITNTDQTNEAVASGIGICLLAAGNAPIFARGGLTMVPVPDLSPPSWYSPGTNAAAPARGIPTLL